MEVGPERASADRVTDEPDTLDRIESPALAPPRPRTGGPANDPRLPVWARRAAITVVVGFAFTVWQGWRIGLTAAAAVAIADTVYHSRTMSLIPAAARVSEAQRRTRRRLMLLRPLGYRALHRRGIPGTESIIDHVVVGPGGVFAVDSEHWDRRLPVRAIAAGGSPAPPARAASAAASTSAAGPMLYHGPYSQRERLAHACWEAGCAARLVGAELGRPVYVAPAMIIYGPTVPWIIARLRGVDVFAGRRVVRFFRYPVSTRHRLSRAEISAIWQAAEQALPPAR